MSDDLVASAGEQGGPCPALRTSLGVHYRQWFPKFVGFLIKDCGVRQAKAEDIVHSAYEAVWQKLAGTPVEAQRWQAATEAERTTYVRRQVLWRRGDDRKVAEHEVTSSEIPEDGDRTSASLDPAEVVVRNETSDEVRVNLQRMSPRDRIVLALEGLGYSPAEQAVYLGVKSGAARTAGHRARARYETQFPMASAEGIE